ncbi:Arabinan endo-1,5-alpha-L-arabinosidase A precursor [Phytophthora palmivora]|uniref:Endo-1,5-alpha-L-arabinanase A n=1 Tax=Phytophthora palmivora TaxID=4796 RepID=A0A2P4Y2Z8_9STRA|nr:Arabinan endo-1,5-alpha-L-arabinosidase A precursor [Phytophthora palmivora]
MVKTLAWFVGFPFLVVSTVNGYATPGACSGICTNAHDPSIIQNSNGTYYRFSTGNKIAVHSAPDISGPWKYEGAALPDGSSIDLKGKDDLWAPDVSKVGDFYYLYQAPGNNYSISIQLGLDNHNILLLEMTKNHSHFPSPMVSNKQLSEYFFVLEAPGLFKCHYCGKIHKQAVSSGF